MDTSMNDSNEQVRVCAECGFCTADANEFNAHLTEHNIETDDHQPPPAVYDVDDDDATFGQFRMNDYDVQLLSQSTAQSPKSTRRGKKSRTANLNQSAGPKGSKVALNHKCDICSSKFSNRTNLMRHLQRHTGIKPFQCRFCLKRFFRKDHMQEHAMTHLKQNGGDPNNATIYECAACTQCFTTDHLLQEHLVLVHYTNDSAAETAADVPCRVCGHLFHTPDTLMIHFHTEHTMEKTAEADILLSRTALVRRRARNRVRGQRANVSNRQSSSSIPSLRRRPIQSKAVMPHSDHNELNMSAPNDMFGQILNNEQLNNSLEGVPMREDLDASLIQDNLNDLNTSQDIKFDWPGLQEHGNDTQEQPTALHLAAQSPAAASSFFDRFSSRRSSTALNSSPATSTAAQYAQERQNLDCLFGHTPSISASNPPTHISHLLPESSDNNESPSAANSPSCSANSVTHLANQHQAGHSTPNSYSNPNTRTCAQCEISFNDVTLYLLHKGLHSSDRSPWRCNLCGQVCRDKYEFHTHIITADHS